MKWFSNISAENLGQLRAFIQARGGVRKQAGREFRYLETAAQPLHGPNNSKDYMV
jgi:hypothetical protein